MYGLGLIKGLGITLKNILFLQRRNTTQYPDRKASIIDLAKLDNKNFILKVPNSSARMDIKLGNEITVGWDSHDCRALDPK